MPDPMRTFLCHCRHLGLPVDIEIASTDPHGAAAFLRLLGFDVLRTPATLNEETKR